MSSSFVRPEPVSGISGQAVERGDRPNPKMRRRSPRAPPAGVPQAETGRKVKAEARRTQFARPQVEAKAPRARRGASRGWRARCASSCCAGGGRGRGGDRHGGAARGRPARGSIGSGRASARRLARRPSGTGPAWRGPLPIPAVVTTGAIATSRRPAHHGRRTVFFIPMAASESPARPGRSIRTATASSPAAAARCGCAAAGLITITTAPIPTNGPRRRARVRTWAGGGASGRGARALRRRERSQGLPRLVSLPASSQSASTIVTLARPPPSHMVCRP